IDSTDDDLKRLADRVRKRGFVIGSLVAPVWPPTGGGSAMGSAEERRNFLTQVRKSCAIGRKLRDISIRQYGIVRIDSACSPAEWAKDPAGNTKRIAETFRHAWSMAVDYGERLAAEGEICWGGMHSWKHMAELLVLVNRPKTLGLQADMAHTLLFTLGYNAPDERILPEAYDWKEKEMLYDALASMNRVLRPWVVDFHIAQNDATLKGSDTHDKTCRHRLPNDPNGKIDVARALGLGKRDNHGS